MARARSDISTGTGTSTSTSDASRPLLEVVGAGLAVPCLDGSERPYVDLDCAASTPSSVAVAQAVGDFLPSYSSVHRGAGFKSRAATEAYESVRARALRFAGREDDTDTAIICRNTTEAINHLAYRLRLEPDDIVLTTVLEHHANLLPWARYARRRYVECDSSGMFGVDDVVAGLDAVPAPKVLAITGASNITGWTPPVEEVCSAAHARGVLVVLDAAQLAPHRPIPCGRDGDGPDFVAWSGHKMYAPFGAGVLVGPSAAFAEGDPFLAGGGAVELVDLDEVLWSEPPEREEAGSPNVIGAVALGAAMDELSGVGWDAIARHERVLADRLRRGLAAIEGVRLLGPSLGTTTLPVATFEVEGVAHGLVAARLSAEFGIGVRHGCFCAHPYLMRLLGLSDDEIGRYRDAVRQGDRSVMPGAVRASGGIQTSDDDVDRLLEAVRVIASGEPAPVAYAQEPATGDWSTDAVSWLGAGRAPTGCGGV